MLSAAADAASGGAVAASALFDVAPDQYVVVAEPPPPKLPVGPSVGALLAAFGGEQAQQAVHAWASAAVSTADPATLLRFPLASNHLCFDFYTEAKLYKLVNHSVYAKLLNHLQPQPPVGWAAFAGVLAGKARGSIPRGGTRGRPRQRVTQSRPSGSRRWRSGRSRRRWRGARRRRRHTTRRRRRRRTFARSSRGSRRELPLLPPSRLSALPPCPP